MNANWFIALPVAAERWFDRVLDAPAGVTLMHRDDLHCTVAFLGPVDEARALRAFDGIHIALAPLEVTLGDVVPMGDPHKYSALSALLARGRVEVERAMSECRDRALESARRPRERWPAKAHVTLARPTRDATARQRAEALAWAAKLSLGETPVRLDRIALYTWSLERHTVGAPRFRQVESSPLVER